MMIRYKGSYCPIQQYMPNKPKKWGLKVWCLVCSITKYVWNIEIDCGKECLPHLAPLDLNGEPPPLPPRTPHEEAKLAHNLVLRLVEGLWHHSHVIVMDNYFSLIGLYMDLLERGTYATGTIRTNRVGLPDDLKNTKTFKNVLQGTTLWRMHDD